MSVFTTCERSHDTSSEVVLPVQKLLNVPYGNDSAQRMDIYLPEGRTVEDTRSIILIHGGGWNAGSKSDFASYIDSFRKRMPDLAIFNIEYRLFNGGNIFPTQEMDIRSAMNFIMKNADHYRINTNKLVLLGASAGAHLALLQAYKYREPGIRAVIDFFGPTDLTAMYEKPWHPMVTYALKMITGTTPAENPFLYQQSSPANFVNAQSAPTLILHGSNDQVVDVSQSKLLQHKLEKEKVYNEIVIYPGERHGWYGKTLSNSFDRIEAFLKKQNL